MILYALLTDGKLPNQGINVDGSADLYVVRENNDPAPTGYQDISTNGYSFTYPNPDGGPDISVSKTGLEVWDFHGTSAVGSRANYRDKMCQLREIYTKILTEISGNWSNWDVLTANEKVIACKWLPSIVPDADFAEVYPTDTLAKQAEIKLVLQSDLRPARTMREAAVSYYLAQNLSDKDAIDVAKDLSASSGIFTMYHFFNTQSMDQVTGGYTSGIIDYFNSANAFTGQGFLQKTYEPISANTIPQIGAGVVDIIQNGYYDFDPNLLAQF